MKNIISFTKHYRKIEMSSTYIERENVILDHFLYFNALSIISVENRITSEVIIYSF